MNSLKTLVLFAVFASWVSNLKSQDEYVIAGAIDSGYHFDIEPNVTVVALVEYGEGETKKYEIDIDYNGEIDFTFIVTNNGGQGGWFESVYITPERQNTVSFSHNFIVIPETSECDTSYRRVAKKYYDGDTIKYDTNFMNKSLTLNSDSWLYFCYDFEINWWYDTEDLFVGVCVEDSINKTLGWIRVYNVGYNRITFDSYFFDDISASVEEQKGIQEISFYPNPTTGNLTLELEDLFDDISISVYDLNGKLMSQSGYYRQKKINLNVSNLEVGLYLLKIKLNNQVKISKFIKE